MEKREVKVERRMKLEEAIAYLTEMLGKVDSEGISLEDDRNGITLKPKPEVLLKVKGKRKKGRDKFSISMSWLTGEQVSLEDGVIASPAVIRADGDDGSREPVT